MEYAPPGYAERAHALDQDDPTRVSRARQQAVTQLLETGTFAPFEKEYWTKDGRRGPVLVGSTFLSKEGERSRLLAFVLDLTARKALEKSQAEQ